MCDAHRDTLRSESGMTLTSPPTHFYSLSFLLALFAVRRRMCIVMLYRTEVSGRRFLSFVSTWPLGPLALINGYSQLGAQRHCVLFGLLRVL